MLFHDAARPISVVKSVLKFCVGATRREVRSRSVAAAVAAAINAVAAAGVELGAEVGVGKSGVQRPRIWSPDPDFAPDLLQAAAAGELPGVELQIPINRFRLAIFASKSGSDLTNCSM